MCLLRTVQIPHNYLSYTSTINSIGTQTTQAIVKDSGSNKKQTALTISAHDLSYIYRLFRPPHWPSSVDGQGRGTLTPMIGWDRPRETSLRPTRTFRSPLLHEYEWGPRWRPQDPRDPAPTCAPSPGASILTLDTWEMQKRYGTGQYDDHSNC